MDPQWKFKVRLTNDLQKGSLFLTPISFSSLTSVDLPYVYVSNLCNVLEEYCPTNYLLCQDTFGVGRLVSLGSSGTATISSVSDRTIRIHGSDGTTCPRYNNSNF